MSVESKIPIGKNEVEKPNLSWAEISALVYVVEHQKDKRLTKLGLNSNRLNAIRRAQKKMTIALEAYIEAGK